MKIEGFSNPRPNLIVSSRGFSVEILGRTGMQYSEGERSLFVDSEVLAIPNAMALYSDSLTSWGPPHGTPLSEAERTRIFDNIRRALRFKGYDLQVI